MVALRIERQFTKQQILELYVNRIYFGTGCYGVETGVANLLWQKRVKAESLRSRTPCRLDPKPESVLAAKKSGGRSRSSAMQFWIGWWR